MTKHTIKDFLDGRICVRCADQDDKQRLLQVCTEAGIAKTWCSTLSIQQTVAFFNVFYVDRDAFALAIMSEATAKFCDVVLFSSLVNDTSPRRIVIDCSDTITTATLYNGEKAVKSATINRCHSDNPSVHIAAVKVIDKLLAKKAKQPNLKKPAEKDGFKVGDRVVCTKPYLECGDKHGRIAVMERTCCGIGVEFDEDFAGSHSCSGYVKSGRGYWLSRDCLRHEQPAKQAVREVKRKAKVGEWVKIVEADHGHGEKYKTGDVLRVVRVDRAGCVSPSCGGFVASPREYVVLEGYKPEEPTNA